jgi:hypothetical protein
MAIHVLCPHCHSPFVLGDELANQVFTCTHCGGLIPIPPLPPPPLPPIEMIEGYHHVVGDQPPLILDILGIFTRWRWDSSGGDVMRFVWSLRYIVLFILAVVYTFKYTGSADKAIYGAPRFFGAMVVCVLWGYLEAVWIARKKDLEEGDPPKIWVASLIINPMALLASDVRDTLPAYRAWALAAVLCFSCLCVSQTAGSIKFLIPSGVREGISALSNRPHSPPVVIDDEPVGTDASGTSAAAAPASAPATTPATGPVYHPEDGPPPPPPDQ